MNIEPVIKTITITPKTNFSETFANITRGLTTEAARIHINHYKQNIDGIKFSAFHLIDNNTFKNKKNTFTDAAYSIIDGGHRLTALWEHAKENGVEHKIRIYAYDWEMFNHDRNEAIEHYELINKARKQSKINILEANSFQSEWVKFFDKTRINISFEQAVKKLSWTNVITSYLNVKSMLAKNKIIKVSGFETDVLKHEFLTGNKDEMKHFQMFLNWWIPIAESAKKEYKIGTLYSVPFLTAGFLIWHENQSITFEDGEKLVRFPRFMKLAKYAHGNLFPDLIKYCLYAINYKNTRRRFIVFDEQGSEPENIA